MLIRTNAVQTFIHWSHWPLDPTISFGNYRHYNSFNQGYKYWDVGVENLDAGVTPKVIISFFIAHSEMLDQRPLVQIYSSHNYWTGMVVVRNIMNRN